MTLAPGTTVGRYQILEPLGQGGMATVYKAFQPSLQREVALKVLRPGYAQDQEFRERFEREAIAIAKLRHPHIVQVFDFEVASSGEYVLAMEFLEGGTLKERLTKLASEGRGIDPAESVRILGEVAEALSYAHEKGIVHRDVKPSNVMLTHKDWAVVTDFGIARIMGATSHTQTGVGIGTPEYMAPEQGQGQGIDHRADIYSLGAMAYELLTGRVPYTADTPLAVVLAHIKDPLPLPSKVNPSIGKGIEKVLLRALAKDPQARFDSAVAFADALKAALADDTKGGTMPTVVVRAGAAAGVTPTPRRVPAQPKQITLSIPPVLAQRPMVTGVVGAVVLAIVVGGVVAGNALRTSPVTSPAVTSAPTLAASAGPTALATAAPTTPPGTLDPSKPPKFAIPAKGALLWQAALDGTSIDLPIWTSEPTGGSEVRFPRGAIELAVTKPGTAGFGNMNSPSRSTFVAELDLAGGTLTGGTNAGLTWTLLGCGATNGSLRAFIDLGHDTIRLDDWTGPAGGDAHNDLTAQVPIAGISKGQAHTLAAVVSTGRVSLYVDEQRIADVPYSRCVQGAARNIALASFDTSVTTMRITGARLYAPP